MSESSDDSAAEKRNQRRREITAAAREVFAERGFHQASISDIIERAKIARGTFYLYFSSKDTVFDSILDQAIDELRGLITRVDMTDGARPPRQQLDDNMTRVLGFVLADRALIQILLNHGLPPDSDAARRVEGFFGHVSELIQSSLTFGTSVGLVRSCDVSVVSSAIVGAVRGVVGHLITLDEPQNLDQLAKELLDFALTGVLAD